VIVLHLAVIRADPNPAPPATSGRVPVGMITRQIPLLFFMVLSILSRTVIAFHSSSKQNASVSLTKLVQMSSTKLHVTDPSVKRVLVPIAQDSEEIETSCITDTLTRFGANVVVASTQPDGNLVCKMSRGLKVCKIFNCFYL
jgi:hypothetical protein